MKTAFTLLELLIVIVIVGVLATIALPNFNKMIDKAKADQAVTYLKVIRSGEKIYYAGNSAYIACANAAEIKSNLGAEITEDSYTFTVTGNPNISNSFIATAASKSDATTIILNQDGNWSGTSPFKP